MKRRKTVISRSNRKRRSRVVRKFLFLLPLPLLVLLVLLLFFLLQPLENTIIKENKMKDGSSSHLFFFS
jgi:hypothetical protein